VKFLRRFFMRLSNLATGRSADQRLQDELAEHLAFQIEENLRAGMSPTEARRQAALKLGSAEAIREHHHAEQSLPFIENLLFDLRYAVRMLLRSPGFSIIAIATMALGVGATTAIYSVIDATLLHPLPYPQPEQLVRIVDDLPGVGAQGVGISVPEWRDLESSGIFQSAAITGRGANVNLTGGAQPLRLSFKQVTPNYFSVLGVDAQLGRTFDPHDATPGYNLEVVLSDGLWRREFGADPHVLGKAVRLDNDVYHVVGVMPRGFRDQGSTSDEQNVELWLGAGFAGVPFPPPLRDSRLRSRVVIARLEPGLSIAAAQRHLDVLVESLTKQYPAEYPAQTAWTVRLIPLSETVVGSVRQSLILLFGAVGLVLLISCVNVANLLLARTSVRSREIAVRQAMGAQKTRLIRQLLTESLLLFLLGGIAGFAVLFCARHVLLRLVPESLPHLNNISISWGVLGFALAVSVAAGTVFGLAPAWLMSRLDLTGTLRQEGRGSSGSLGRSRARQALVVTELALSLVLMVAAGLLLRSFWDLFAVQPGFNPDRVMAIETWLPGPNDPTTDPYQTATQEAVLLREILRRARTLPGVEEAAVGDETALPLGHSDPTRLPLIQEGNREGIETKENQAPLIESPIVSPEYFHLLGMPLERGRIFNEQDIETTPQVAVINQAAARTYWPNQDPVGKRVRLHLDTRGLVSSAKPAWTTIIGVIADARTESLADAGIPQIYRSVYQRASKEVTIFLRGQLDPSSISAQVRSQVQAVDATLPVFHAETLDEVLATSLSVRRFSMEMTALFAATALLLAGLGIYGTISYVVNEQRREIAIRIALGAQRGNILKMVLRRGLVLAAAGAGLGVAGALIVSHLMAGLLFGVSPDDLPTFAGVTIVLTGVALAASYIPALRAMRLDPITTLHSE
jgi:putative ABC transport system permease protein